MSERDGPRDGPRRRAGVLQPHVVFVAGRGPSLLIDAVSSNADELGAPATAWLGRGLGELLTATSVTRVTALLDEGAASRSLRVTSRAGVLYDATVRGRARGLTLELEPVERSRRPPGPTTSEVALEAALDAAAMRMRACVDADEVAELVARSLAELTGFTRVLFIEVDAEGHGVVRAMHGEPSVLGAHVPAMDLPSTLLTEPCRWAPDLDAVPVDILANDHDVLGLDDEEWLARMPSLREQTFFAGLGAKAALTLAIVRDGAIAGVAMALHDSPRWTSPRVRATVRELGRRTALTLEAFAAHDVVARRSAAAARFDTLTDEIVARGASAFEGALARGAVDATGVVLVERGEVVARAGIAPTRDAALALIAHAADDGEELVPISRVGDVVSDGGVHADATASWSCSPPTPPPCSCVSPRASVHATGSAPARTRAAWSSRAGRRPSASPVPSTRSTVASSHACPRSGCSTAPHADRGAEVGPVPR